MSENNSEIQLYNKAVPALNNMTSALTAAENSFYDLQNAVAAGFNISNIAIFKQNILNINLSLSQTNNFLLETGENISDAANKQDQLNKKIDEGASSAGGFFSVIDEIANKVTDKLSFENIMNLSDSLIQTDNALNALTGDAEKTAALQDKIMNSANSSRVSYQSMAETVAQMGSGVNNPFSNTDEIVTFTELVNKQLSVSGVVDGDRDALMSQITQVMTSGSLSGEDFNSIFQQAPGIMQTVADYMGVPVNAMQSMAAEGQISSETIKNAMLGSASEINEKFGQVPATFSEIKTLMENNIAEAFIPIAETIGSVLQWVSENWSTLKPILVGVAAAVGILTAASAINSAVTWLQVAANRALATSLLTNPIVWIALAIGVLVAFIYKWIQSVGGIKNAWELFKILITAAWYSIQLAFYKGIYFVMKLADSLMFKWNSVCVSIANFLGDLKVSVLTVLQNMVNGAIDIINDFISVINNIPGVNIEAVEHVTFAATAEAENEAAKQERAKQLAAYQKELAENDFERTTKLNQLESERDSLMLEYHMLNDTYRKQAETEEMSNEQYFKQTETEEDAEYLGGIEDYTAGTYGDTSEINDTIQASSDEELDFLRSLAEREAVNKYTTAEIKLDFTSNANIKSDMDIDGMINSFTDELQRTLVTTASALER